MKSTSILAVLLTAAALRAQPTEAPSEVSLADGSVLAVRLLQESVVVDTRYGKLSVPLKDVDRISFGLRPSAADEERIKAAVAALSSTNWKERSGATKALLAFGPVACCYLSKAASGPDAEAAKRACELFKKIEDAHGPAELLRRSEDVVHTDGFEVVGHVIGTIEVESAVCGKLSLQPINLRSLLVQRLREKEVVVRPDGDWCDGGVDVPFGGRVRIVVSGQVDMWVQTPGQYLAGPRGLHNISSRLSGHQAGALLAKVGGGEPFAVGELTDKRVVAGGRLRFSVAPSTWGDPSTAGGGFRASVRASPR